MAAAAGGATGAAIGDGWLPIYCDDSEAKVRLPEELMAAGATRVHLLTAKADAEVEESFKKSITGGADEPFVSFVPSRDCRFVCVGHTPVYHTCSVSYSALVFVCTGSELCDGTLRYVFCCLAYACVSCVGLYGLGMLARKDTPYV